MPTAAAWRFTPKQLLHQSKRAGDRRRVEPDLPVFVLATDNYRVAVIQELLRSIQAFGVKFLLPSESRSNGFKSGGGRMGVNPDRQTTVEAKPEPITIDAAQTAVVVVDMQNDFCSKYGLFDRAGINISAVQEAIAPTCIVLSATRKAGIKIVYLKMGFRPDLSDLGDSDSPNRVRHLHFGVGQPCIAPDGRQGRFLIRDTWNTDVIENLRPQPEDVVLYKHRFSGFYQTELDDTLRRLGIKNLIFTGCTTSVCVDSTIRDAMFRDYRCVLLADCTGEPIGSDLPRSNHEASVLTIERLFGWVSDSERFVSALHDASPLPAEDQYRVPLAK